MNRLEYGFRPSPRQVVDGEVEKLFASRHQRIQRVLITEGVHLMPVEKAQLSTLEIELDALQSVLVDQLFGLDLKINLAVKHAQEAKFKG
jgi:hypothetical protein